MRVCDVRIFFFLLLISIPRRARAEEAHAYTLPECLALADRNAPNLWAAKARLSFARAQLDEAKTVPFSQWSASSKFGVLPTLGGTPFYNQVPRNQLTSQGLGGGLEPFLQFSVQGVVPLYTFGKIETVKRAAEAQVRYSEWDMEKDRTQLRADVRRAFYSLEAARDGMYVANDILDKLNDNIDQTQKRLQRGDSHTTETDEIRLEIYRDEVRGRIAEAHKGESYASAALRFLTGVQSNFDIPDSPLARPEHPLMSIVRYLTAARMFRPDVNRARAGVQARKALLDFSHAQLFPNFGVGLGFNYSVAPSATPQNTAWIGDPFNGFGAAFAFGMEWALDLLPKSARIAQAASQLEEARAMERYALGGVAVEVESAHAAAVEAQARVDSWEHAERRAKHWVSATQDAIDLGTQAEPTLVEPLRAYVTARASHIQALLDLNVSLSELARVTGWDQAAGS